MKRRPTIGKQLDSCLRWILASEKSDGLVRLNYAFTIGISLQSVV